MSVSRREVSFESRGCSCSGWLFEPEGAAEPPVVLMAHGFGARASWRLPAYAETFAEGGLAALVFDYRGFGASEGTPRGLVDASRHREDWRAAVDHARSYEALDGDRLALWGTSMSGGHVLETAAEGDVTAVVVQIPFVDGPATAAQAVRRGGLGSLARATAAGVRDLAGAALGKEPYRIPVAGEPGDLAVVNAPRALEGYASLVPEDEEWSNRCPARIVLSTMVDRPIRRADEIQAPVLVVEAEHDEVLPSGPVRRLVEKLTEVDHEAYPIGHFEAYHGEAFERIVERQRAFLREHLLEPELTAR